MRQFISFKLGLAVLVLTFLTSCEDYLEVEPPDHKMVSQNVFNSDESARSAMKGIYNLLAAAEFSSGGGASVTVLAGLSSDNVTTIRTWNLPYMEFDQHEILPDNFRNTNLWSSAYNLIYMTNSLLEGLEEARDISEEVRTQLEGEARVVRAFIYFYLVNLYGEVPLILTTDYRENSLAGGSTGEEVHQQIMYDLQIAVELLEPRFSAGERTEINRTTAIALLARINLYHQNWEEAEILSSQVISEKVTYEILEDLDQVFLANSKEAIWQLAPIGRGDNLTNTKEGSVFLIHPFLTFLSHVELTDDLIAAFKEEDKRLHHWIAFHQRLESYYPTKYKVRNSTEDVSEYSMVLRLAEQYLIRAEARAMQGDLSGAIADLDTIRIRAGLQPVADLYPALGKAELLDLIFEERRRELFTEWGHRWLDLKRTGMAAEFLKVDNPLWQNTDVFYPIPEAELMKNPNLVQNPGY